MRFNMRIFVLWRWIWWCLMNNLKELGWFRIRPWDQLVHWSDLHKLEILSMLQIQKTFLTPRNSRISTLFEFPTDSSKSQPFFSTFLECGNEKVWQELRVVEWRNFVWKNVLWRKWNSGDPKFAKIFGAHRTVRTLI